MQVFMILSVSKQPMYLSTLDYYPLCISIGQSEFCTYLIVCIKAFGIGNYTDNTLCQVTSCHPYQCGLGYVVVKPCTCNDQWMAMLDRDEYYRIMNKLLSYS